MSVINLTFDAPCRVEDSDSKLTLEKLIVHRHKNDGDIQADSLLVSSIGGNYLAYTSKGNFFFKLSNSYMFLLK